MAKLYTVDRAPAERISPYGAEAQEIINSRNLSASVVETTPPSTSPPYDGSFVLLGEDLTLANQTGSNSPEVVSRLMLDTLDSDLNESYQDSLYSMGVTPYILMYESETYQGRTPRSVGADGWPSFDVDAINYILENKYGVVPNASEPKWVMLDWENPFSYAIGYGRGPSMPDDQQLKGPVNRRATQILIDCVNGVKNYFGSGIRLTIYGMPYMQNFPQTPFMQTLFANRQWVQATEEDRQKRIEISATQCEDLLAVLDWYPGYGWIMIPREESLVRSGGTVLQRADTDPYNRFIGDRFTEESMLEMESLIGSLKALNYVSDPSTVQGKPVVPFIACDLYRDLWHYRVNTPVPETRRSQIIPNAEFLARVEQMRGDVHIDGLCLWSVIQFWSRVWATSEPPINYGSISGPLAVDYSTTMRGSIIRTFFSGIDPIGSGQFSSWADPGLKSTYAIAYNNRTLDLIEGIFANANIQPTRSAVVSTRFTPIAEVPYSEKPIVGTSDLTP